MTWPWSARIARQIRTAAAVVLVDTSAWIEVFRRGSKVNLGALVDFDDVVTCLPVIQEVLQGFDDERDFMAAQDALLALPIVESPMKDGVFIEAADPYRRARRTGRSPRAGALRGWPSAR